MSRRRTTQVRTIASRNEGPDMTMQKMTRIARSVQRRCHPLYSALYSALVYAVLVASLGLSCDKLEKLDKESDKVLNNLNAPGGSSSSSQSTSSGGSGSGLTVVKRKAMPLMTVRDPRGNRVEVWGQSSSASTTPGHADTIADKATAMAKRWTDRVWRNGSGPSRGADSSRPSRTATPCGPWPASISPRFAANSQQRARSTCSRARIISERRPPQ